MKKIGERLCALGSKWQTLGKVGIWLFIGGVISFVLFLLIQLAAWEELYFFSEFAITHILIIHILAAIVLGIFWSPLYLCGMFATCFGQIEINTRGGSVKAETATAKANNAYQLPEL